MNTTSQPPVIRITGGHPTPAEIAAVITALTTAATPSTPLTPTPTPTPTSGWADHRRRLRTPLHPGPDAWRITARTS